MIIGIFPQYRLSLHLTGTFPVILGIFPEYRPPPHFTGMFPMIMGIFLEYMLECIISPLFYNLNTLT